MVLLADWSALTPLVGWIAITPLRLLEFSDSPCPSECDDYNFVCWSVTIALVDLSVMTPLMKRNVMTSRSVMAPLVQWSFRTPLIN